LGLQGKKLIASSVAILGFIGLLLIVYVIHARFLSVEVVLYAALQDVVLTTALVCLALWLVPMFAVLELAERLQLAMICLLGGYAFAISVPTVIDRSLSFYLLEKLDQRGGGIRHDAMEAVITTEFMREYRVLDARITEQLASGTIVIDDECIRLTARGARTAALSRFIRTHFLPRHRNLMGTYSDDLTEPFRRSATEAPYACPRSDKLSATSEATHVQDSVQVDVGGRE
jgi:hypothetical protein